MPRVLIVDDEPAIVDYLREFLTGKEYAVVTAPDGSEALPSSTNTLPRMSSSAGTCRRLSASWNSY